MKLNHAVFFRDLYNSWPFESIYDRRCHYHFLNAQGIRNGAKYCFNGLRVKGQEHNTVEGMHFSRNKESTVIRKYLKEIISKIIENFLFKGLMYERGCSS